MSLVREKEQIRRRQRPSYTPMAFGPVLLIALSVAFFVGGCGDSDSAVPKAVLLAVLAAVKAAKSLRFNEGELSPQERDDLEDEAREMRLSEDRHKGFFAYRRAEVLAQADPTLLQDPSFTALTARVLQDLSEVESFVTSKFQGPNSLAQDAPDGPTSPGPDGALRCDPGKHIDLADAARARTSAPATNKLKLEEYRSFRIRNAKAIIWRAAGIEKNLWNDLNPQPPRLRVATLTEILDRRLRIVERMHMLVNGSRAAFLVRGPGGGQRGPWVDGSRVRPVEYPEIHQRNPLSLLGSPVEPFWRLLNEDDPNHLVYERDFSPLFGSLPTRIAGEPDQISPVWKPNSFEPYIRDFDGRAGTLLANAVNGLIQPSVDVWQRSWLYCDHVVPVLHLDALRFGLLRRNQNDDQFNGIPETGSISLFPALGLVPDDPDAVDTTNPLSFQDDSIFRGNNLPWFDNIFVRPEKFQIGDQLIFWNHALYEALFAGAFRLENAVVTEIESDPEKGGIIAASMRLEGHGMNSVSRRRTTTGVELAMAAPGLAVYAEEMANDLNKAMARVRRLALDAAGLTEFKLDIGSRESAVILWKPYPAIDRAGTAGPWFIFLPRIARFADHFNDRWGSAANMLKNIYNSVLDDPSPIAGYTPRRTSVTIDGRTFDLSDGVLFPLYVPVATGETEPMTWRKYFTRLHRDPALTVMLVELELATPDATQLQVDHLFDPDLNQEANDLTGDIPGLFLGTRRVMPVQILRPKVR